jgi:hypothetical protein
MNFQLLLTWLQDTDIATSIREGALLFPWIECIHVLAITFVVGSIAAVDFRLLGLASLDRRFSRLNAEIVPLTWIGFAIAVASGGLLFSSKAVQYADNLPFRLKMACLLLAGANMAVFQFRVFRSVAEWDNAHRPPLSAKVAGALSLFLWIAIVACGRVIGFSMADLAG